MRVRPWFILVVAAALLFCGGCHSVPAPPGFVGGGPGTAGSIELPPELSRPAQFALLSCYIDQEGAEAARWAAASLAVAQNARQRLKEELLAEQTRPLREKYAETLAVGEDGTLSWRPGALSSRTDWDALEAMFAEVEGFVRSRQSLPVPALEIRNYLSARKDVEGQQRFEEWLRQGHDSLELAAADNSVQLFELQRLRDAVRKKCELLATERQAKELMATGEGLHALAILDDALKGVGGDNAPEVLDDYATRPRLEAMRRQVPQLIVSREIEELSALPLEQWELGEARLSRNLRLWRREPLFAEALEQNADVIRNQAAIFAQERRTAMTDSVHKLLEKDNLWCDLRARDDIASQLAMWEEDDADKECYFDAITAEVGKELTTQLRQLHNQVLQAIARHSLAVQQRASEVENLFGVVVLTDELLEGLAASDQKLVTPEELARSRERAGHALRMLAEKKFAATAEVGEVTAERLGMGVAWQRDIVRRLKDFLTAMPSSLASLWTVREASPFVETAEVRHATVILADGVLAEYGCTSEPERIAARMFRCVSAPRREAGADQKARFVQELYDQEIVTRTIERVAHIRLTFTLRLADGVEKRLEINEVLRREFVVEETRPLQSAGRHVVDDAAAALPVSVTPTLRVDRVWSEGEMLDEARRRVLDQVALQVMDLWCQSVLKRAKQIALGALMLETLKEEAADGVMEEFGEVQALGKFLVPKLMLKNLPPLPQEASPEHQAIHDRLKGTLEELHFVLTDGKGVVE